MAKNIFILISIISWLFPVVGAFGQTKANPNTSISRIKKTVRLIATNSNLRKVVFDRSNIPDSVIERFKTYRGSIEYVIAFYSADTIKQLKIRTRSLYPTETDYYFDNRQVIFITEKYHNNSRMGSCGDLDIENRLYYSSQKLIKVETIEVPFECYNEKVNSGAILRDLKKILTFLDMYGSPKIRLGSIF